MVVVERQEQFVTLVTQFVTFQIKSCDIPMGHVIFNSSIIN